DGSFSNKGLQVGAESGQHITVTIKNMNVNELIGKAVKKDGVTFGVSNWETDSNHAATGTDADLEYDQQTNGKVELTTSMLNKFYVYDSTKIVDTDNQADPQGSITGNTVDDAPTAADFAALNAFAKSAIKTVSEQRSDLGAIQNRLEHTISNLDNIVENTTSAESEIRDTDIATEMVRYSNNNILQQAGTSMLSQANQANQLALSLLG
ncbi:MAG: flagellin, partial [Roseburia sp.]